MNDFKIDSGRLLRVIDDIYSVWDEFCVGGPGIIPAARCRVWAKVLLGIMDDGEMVMEGRERRNPAPRKTILQQNLEAVRNGTALMREDW